MNSISFSPQFNRFAYQPQALKFAATPVAGIEEVVPPDGTKVKLVGKVQIKQVGPNDEFAQEQLKKLYHRYLTTYNRKNPSSKVLLRVNSWLNDIFHFPSARIFLATYPVQGVDDGKKYSLPAGFVIGWAQPEPSEVSTFYWHNLYVDDAVRLLGDKGVATELTDKLVRTVWKQNFSKIVMKTHITNRASQSLYGDPNRKWSNDAHFETMGYPDTEGFIPFSMFNPKMPRPEIKNQSTTTVLTPEQRAELRKRQPTITMINGVAQAAFI